MDEQDDYPDDVEPVELVTEPCPGCGREYTHPADECDPCCSGACAERFHAARQAEVNAALASWWNRERETMREFRCTECDAAYKDYPTTDGCCSTTCRWEQVARLYAPTQPGAWPVTETELKARADEAWAAMVQRTDVGQGGRSVMPMPPAIALDMVQDVTGDRDDAVTAILQAASDWLNTLRVGALLRGIGTDGSEVHTGNARDAELVAAYIRSESLGLAMTHVVHIHERSRPAATARGAEARACLWWRGWEEDASLALNLCHQTIEAANTTGAA